MASTSAAIMATIVCSPSMEVNTCMMKNMPMATLTNIKTRISGRLLRFWNHSPATRSRLPRRLTISAVKNGSISSSVTAAAVKLLTGVCK